MSNEDDLRADLRRQAEKRLHARFKDPLTLPPDQFPSLIHELEVHQIELEMQNEELHRSHFELELAQERFADLFDYAPVSYLILDATGWILQANLAATDLLKRSRAQLCGNNFFRFVVEGQRDRLYHHLRAVFRTKTGQRCEVEMGLDDESRISLHLNSVLYPNADGDAPQCLTLVSDITELKQAEADSRKAKEMAEEANRAKTHFLSAASHDLRQPLQAMTTINEILKSKLDDDELLGLVSNLSECIGNMKALFCALLNINQLESGSIIPNIKEFPVDELLRRIGDTFRPLAQQKGLRLHLVHCSATIRSDPVLLCQILDNLVSNAIHYTDTGRVLVGCRYHGGNLRIEIWDTGVGIPEDQHEHIFEDFYQLANRARDHNKGLGLGLAIASRAARLLGTQINLTSWGNGSRFALEMPIAAFNGDDARRPNKVAAEGAAASAASLLVVDDNSIVLFALSHLLEAVGHEVTAAGSLAEALEKTDGGARKFDLIITDYRLGNGETGKGLIDSIRQALGSNIPALIITGDLGITNSPEFVTSSIQVLQKPVSAEILNAQILQMLTAA